MCLLKLWERLVCSTTGGYGTWPNAPNQLWNWGAHYPFLPPSIPHSLLCVPYALISHSPRSLLVSPSPIPLYTFWSDSFLTPQPYPFLRLHSNSRCLFPLSLTRSTRCIARTQDPHPTSPFPTSQRQLRLSAQLLACWRGWSLVADCLDVSFLVAWNSSFPTTQVISLVLNHLIAFNVKHMKIAAFLHFACRTINPRVIYQSLIICKYIICYKWRCVLFFY